MEYFKRDFKNSWSELKFRHPQFFEQTNREIEHIQGSNRTINDQRPSLISYHFDKLELAKEAIQKELYLKNYVDNPALLPLEEYYLLREILDDSERKRKEAERTRKELNKMRRGKS